MTFKTWVHGWPEYPSSVQCLPHKTSCFQFLILGAGAQSAAGSQLSGLGDEVSGWSSLPGDRAKVSVWGYSLTGRSHCRLFGALKINFLKTAIYWVALQGFCPH